MDIADTMRDAARRVADAAPDAIGPALVEFVSLVARWPFAVSTGRVCDSDRARSDAFACVIHAASAQGVDVDAIPANAVAAVIDATGTLGMDELRTAYARIRAAKRLKKEPAPDVAGAVPIASVILGVILAQKSDVPLEALAEELDRLNAETPGRERADMVVVAEIGVINYGAQFPGEGISGDFLPPADGAIESHPAPVYVVMMLRPTGALSLNKMMAFMVAYLGLFLPGANLPPWDAIEKDVDRHVVVFCGYQHNLAGELVPVPRHAYNDRLLAPLPVRIESQDGRLLGLLRLLPWQEGGTVLLEHSQLPLEGLLVFLEPRQSRHAGVVKLKNRQLSYVMPITEGDFAQMLGRIQARTNMVVRPVQPNWTMQKFADEGSSSPLLARLMIGVLKLRDNVFNDRDREAFDRPYDAVLKSVFSARDSMRDVITVWREHERKVTAGEVASVDRNAIRVSENVDRALGRAADAFIVAAARAVKAGLQDVGTALGVSIGFLFQREAGFAAGLLAMQTTDPALADYLRQTRAEWSERLQDARNAIEHEGWTLPAVRYSRVATGVQASEPQIAGLPATDFVTLTFDRVVCCVEDVVVHLLMRRLTAGLALWEVPKHERPSDMPERFRLTLAVGDNPRWVIAYHYSSFQET